jgi:hypothetical protein
MLLVGAYVLKEVLWSIMTPVGSLKTFVVISQCTIDLWRFSSAPGLRQP